MRREGPGDVRIDTAPGLAMPSGGVVIGMPRSARPWVRVEVDGDPLETFDAGGVRLRRWPVSVVLRC
jgi:hypothetical protein